MGESFEHKVIRTNLERITRLISADPSAGPTWFAVKLVERAFLANAAGAVVVGHSEYKWTSVLMGAVMDEIQASQEPKNAFSQFLEILQSNPRLQELARKLDEEYVTLQQAVANEKSTRPDNEGDESGTTMESGGDTEKSEEGKLQVVQQEISKLEDKFGKLVLDAQEVFSEEERKSPSFLPRLHTSLALLSSGQKMKDRYIRFLKASQREIFESSSIGRLFFILSHYWNYYNYSLLEYLIQKFGNEGLKTKLGKYLADLQQFEKSTKVKDFVHACKINYKLPPSSEVIAMEMKDKWADYTLGRVRELSQKLVEAACLEQFCAYFHGRSTVQPHGEPSQEHMVAFRGAEIIAETCCHISGEKPLTYEWKGYGIRIQVPQGALPPDVTSAELCIKASLAGQYEFPEGCELVSGIFWISFPYKFLRSASLDIQHCLALTHPDQCSSPSFIVAKCTQKNLPYRFKPLEGGIFTPYCSYGSISVTQFSMFGIVRKRRRAPNSTQSVTEAAKVDQGDAHVSAINLSAEKQYSAQLYYHLKGINKWLLHFLIFQDLDIYNTVIYQKYSMMNAEPGPYQRVFFEADEITFNISKDGTITGGWSLFPLMYPGLTRKIVDAYKPGQQIPSCQIEIEWTKRDEKPEELLLRVQMIGAKKPYNYFSISRDPICEGPGSPSSQVSRGIHTVPTTSIKRLGTHREFIQEGDTVQTDFGNGATPQRNPKGYREPELKDLIKNVRTTEVTLLGLELGIEERDMNAIKKVNPRNDDALMEVFKKWLNSCAKPMWWAIVDAVEEIGEKRLARELEEKFCKITYDA